MGAEVINQSKVAKRNYSLVDHINSSTLDPKAKTELLIRLTGKRRTMLNGAVFMMQNPDLLRFDDFDHALEALAGVNNEYGLGSVEVYLQREIDAVRRLSDKTLSVENKSLCLYTLQNMMLALGDYEVKEGQKSGYMPKFLQDECQMMLKAANLNMDLDRVRESVRSSAYRDTRNPTLANWDFLDSDLVKKNMESMSHNRVEEKTVVDVTPKQEGRPQVSDTRYLGRARISDATDQEVNRILGKALARFNSFNLQDNLYEFFNFVKDSFQSSSQDVEMTTDYNTLHEVVLATLQRMVEMSSAQQQRIMKQNQMGERSL